MVRLSRDRCCCSEGGVGTQQHAAATDRRVLALPGESPLSVVAIRQAAAPGEPARHRHRLHPGGTCSGHWWEQLLHNQSALRLKARLLNLRGVVVASVPYQLRSAAAGSYDQKVDPLARTDPDAAPGGPGRRGPCVRAAVAAPSG